MARDSRPIWQQIVDLGESVPDAEWQRVPRDLARNLEHYLYGRTRETQDMPRSDHRAKHTHAEELKAICKMITDPALGGEALRTHQGPGPRTRRGGRALWGDAGIADLICFVPIARCPTLRGRWLEERTEEMFYVEVKVGKDKQREAQQKFEKHCIAAGVTYIMGDLRTVADYLGVEVR